MTINIKNSQARGEKMVVATRKKASIADFFDNVFVLFNRKANIIPIVSEESLAAAKLLADARRKRYLKIALYAGLGVLVVAGIAGLLVALGPLTPVAGLVIGMGAGAVMGSLPVTSFAAAAIAVAVYVALAAVVGGLLGGFLGFLADNYNKKNKSVCSVSKVRVPDSTYSKELRGFLADPCVGDAGPEMEMESSLVVQKTPVAHPSSGDQFECFLQPRSK